VDAASPFRSRSCRQDHEHSAGETAGCQNGSGKVVQDMSHWKATAGHRHTPDLRFFAIQSMPRKNSSTFSISPRTGTSNAIVFLWNTIFGGAGRASEQRANELMAVSG
jgi:hypothetical protein